MTRLKCDYNIVTTNSAYFVEIGLAVVCPKCGNTVPANADGSYPRHSTARSGWCEPGIIAPPKPKLSTATTITLGECLGKVIECPDCGQRAEVFSSSSASMSKQPVSARWWMKVKCSGFCGAKLFKPSTPVVVLEVPPSAPELAELAAVIGRWVACPECGARSQAAWKSDDNIGHCICCPQCGVRQKPPDEIVEVMA